MNRSKPQSHRDLEILCIETMFVRAQLSVVSGSVPVWVRPFEGAFAGATFNAQVG